MNLVILVISVLLSLSIVMLGITTPNISVSLYAQNAITTLTPEQINELEKEPALIIQTCNERINVNLEAGSLCESYHSYLSDKCERLDNLPHYCAAVLKFTTLKLKVAAEKSLKDLCASNPPLPNDTARVKACLKYLSSNSTYSMLPLDVTIDHVSKGRIYDGAVEIGFNVTNPNASPVEVRGIYYNISKPGLKLVSGSIEDTQTIKPTSRVYIEGAHDVSRLPQWDKVKDDGEPYSVDGVYYYANSSRVTMSKQFNFTSR